MMVQVETAPVALPSFDELSRAVATNNDWRAMALVLVFLLIAGVLERWFSGWRQAQERKQLLELMERAGTNAEKVTEALSGLREEISIMRAVSSRMEATGGQGHEGHG